MTSLPVLFDRAQFEQALVDGPFHRALALAIDRSGLSLTRLKKRLEAAGTTVSITTLGCWRAGQTRPERSASRRAVPKLESALGLPAGALARLLDSPDGPSARPADELVRWDQLWDRRSQVVPVLQSFETSYETSLLVESVHETLHFDEGRLLRRRRVREVLRARDDRAQVKVVTVRSAFPGHPPRLTATRFCRPGRVETRPEDAFTVAELIVDDWLEEHDTAIVEYEFAYTDPVPDIGYDRRFQHAVANYLLEIRFSPAALPASCDSYRMVSPRAARQEISPVRLAASSPAHLAATALPAGICGVEWHWD
jgi:hypothetical protein